MLFIQARTRETSPSAERGRGKHFACPRSPDDQNKINSNKINLSRNFRRRGSETEILKLRFLSLILIFTGAGVSSGYS